MVKLLVRGSKFTHLHIDGNLTLFLNFDHNITFTKDAKIAQSWHLLHYTSYLRRNVGNSGTPNHNKFLEGCFRGLGN